jgi:hypothetical protein
VFQKLALRSSFRRQAFHSTRILQIHRACG